MIEFPTARQRFGLRSESENLEREDQEETPVAYAGHLESDHAADEPAEGSDFPTEGDFELEHAQEDVRRGGGTNRRSSMPKI